MKKLRMLLTLLVVSLCSWQSAWADDVVANVTMKEKNSLSSEILAISGITDVKIVTHLTVTTQGEVQLGDEDWTTLKSMTALVELDLSNASADAIPNNQFNGYNTNCPNLIIVKLPKDLKTIGEGAFCNKTQLTTVNVPNTVTSIGASAFYSCENLATCDISACNLTKIPNYCFDGCKKLQSFVIPSAVEEIGEQAFINCQLFSSPLPSGLKSIGNSAFNSAAMEDLDIVIPENVTVRQNIFYSTKIRSIELPSTFYDYTSCFANCAKLQEVTLKSPTLISNASSINNAANVTLKVPAHLVASYKGNATWNKYGNIVAITPDVTDYTVSADLNLSNSSMRMTGSPNVFFNESASLTISGDAAQTFNDFTGSAKIYSPNNSSNKYTQILNQSADVTINGDYCQRIYFDDQRWYFLCMPFDFVVGDVTIESGSFVIRTYDGANRNTTNLNTGNWSQNLSAGAEVKAGTGFILKTSEDTWVTFKAKSGCTNYAFQKETYEINTALAANNSNGSASAANTGWNMVGNPWQTFYNIHKMNYSAPFAVYGLNGSSSYTTYSPADDDFALRPFQAILVQCPNGVSSIGFPANGRQLTSTVTSTARTRADNGRKLFDIQIASGEMNDKTRLVVNADATLEYEIGRDASKFFADGTDVPQIYSLGTDGTQYAINERPEENGSLKLGIIFAADGEYTLSAVRNDIGQVILTDHETGIKTDLQQNGYTFEAKAGTSDARFSLGFGSGTTGIRTAMSSEIAEKEVYTLDGIKLGNTTDGLQKGVYVVRQGKNTQKVIIK